MSRAVAFIVALILWPCHLASAQVSQISQQAQACSFADEATGYSLTWHTNCSGYVNFVLTFRNFPTFANYWTGVGYGLLSLELALVENLNTIVYVSSAKLYQNSPPQRSLSSGVIVNPRGAFFGGSLEATWQVHESLLTGCKEWTFFTVPTRVGTPYAGQPYSKLLCNVAETCSRNQCSRGFATPQPSTLYDTYGGYGGGYSRPDLDYLGNQFFQQQGGMMAPLPEQQYGTYSGGLYGGGVTSNQRLYDSYSSFGSQSWPTSGGGIYGSQTSPMMSTPICGGTYGSPQLYSSYQQQQQGLYAGTGSGAYNPYFSPSAGQSFGMGGRTGLYGRGDGLESTYGSGYTTYGGDVGSYYGASSRLPALMVNMDNGYRFPLTITGEVSVHSASPANIHSQWQQSPWSSIKRKSRKKRESLASHRRKRQVSLRGTAYEGQDVLFQRSNPYTATGLSSYYPGAAYSNSPGNTHYGQGSPMYYPYRTTIGQQTPYYGYGSGLQTGQGQQYSQRYGGFAFHLPYRIYGDGSTGMNTAPYGSSYYPYGGGGLASRQQMNQPLFGK